MLIRQATLLDGRIADVRLAERIAEIAPALAREPGELVIEARRGTLLPGLHDHHIHLRAAAAAMDSVMVGPPDAHTPDDFAAAIAAAADDGDGWIRAVGYHESVAGRLNRHVLDALCPSKPLRVQHRSGAMWILNTAALDRIGAASHPDGRFSSDDLRLAAAIPRRDPDLRELDRRLAGYGVTGVTDATPDLDPDDITNLRGAIRQRVSCLSPGKKILSDGQLDLEALTDWIALRRNGDHPVAIHCVTVAQLVVAIAALRAAGTHPSDRIEHAAMVDRDNIEALADLGVTVVTQPNFVAERGDQYRCDIPVDDQDQLWRIRSLIRAGITVAGSTDAPFGGIDPWAAMRAAVRRTTAGGHIVGAAEALTPLRALQLFLGSADQPGRIREIAIGQPGDICLLSVPPATALAELSAGMVELTAVAGQVL
ncbi:MAG: amidohydrolase family protein [Mycobacterium sp.]